MPSSFSLAMESVSAIFFAPQSATPGREIPTNIENNHSIMRRTYLQMYMCSPYMYIQVQMFTYLRTPLHTEIHTHPHTHIHTHIKKNVHIYIHIQNIHTLSPSLPLHHQGTESTISRVHKTCTKAGVYIDGITSSAGTSFNLTVRWQLLVARNPERPREWKVILLE